MSAELEYVNFDIVKEDWTIFELDDGTILKAKFVLKIVLKRKDTIGDYSLNSDTVTAVVVDKKWWGPRSDREYSLKELMAAIEAEDIPFKTKTPDVWNVYKLKDGTTLSVKIELASVSRTKLYNRMGERIYVLNTAPIIKGKIPEELRRKLA